MTPDKEHGFKGSVASQIIVGDCRNVLKEMASDSIHCVVTSPPYFNLRNYEHDDQIGLEGTPAAYIAELVAVFSEVRRVLRPDGVMFLNLGDTFIKKQLVGIPWRVAFALQDEGWLLRSEIIWNKGAHKPERVKDRPTVSHERFFQMTKTPRYFWDAAAVATPSRSSQGRPQLRRARELAEKGGLTDAHMKAIRSAGIGDAGKAAQTQSGTGRNTAAVQALADEAKAVLGGYYREFLIGDTVNIRSVWNVDAKVFPGAHTAVFPTTLIEPAIKAGCPVGGVVLDPFAGTGTTGVVAENLGRSSILIELNPVIADLACARLAHEVWRPTLPLGEAA